MIIKWTWFNLCCLQIIRILEFHNFSVNQDCLIMLKCKKLKKLAIMRTIQKEKILYFQKVYWDKTKNFNWKKFKLWQGLINFIAKALISLLSSPYFHPLKNCLRHQILGKHKKDCQQCYKCKHNLKCSLLRL